MTMMEFSPQTDRRKPSESLTQGGDKLTDFNLAMFELEDTERNLRDHEYVLKVLYERSVYFGGVAVDADPVLDRVLPAIYRKAIMRRRQQRHYQIAKSSQQFVSD